MRLADKVLHLYSIEMDRRMGNKMGSVPMYVLANSQGQLPPVAAGAVFKIKTEVPWAAAEFKAVETKFDGKHLMDEYKDAKRELYHAAFLPFEEDKEDGAIGGKSGKALQMLSKDQIKYREAFQSAETAFLQDMFSKACTLEGLATDPDDIQVKYDDIVTPDKTEQLAEAQFFMGAGFEAKALDIMGVDAAEAADMIQEKDDKQAEQLLTTAKMNGQVDENGDPIVPPVKKAPPVAAAK